MVKIGRLWGDASFGVLPPLHKLVYLYLITQPSITPLGVVQVLPNRIKLDLQMDDGQLQEAYDNLVPRFVDKRIKEEFYDIFIIKSHFDSLPKSAAQMKKAREEGKNSPYRPQLLEIYSKDDFEQKNSFKEPTAQEVSEFALSLGYLVDGARFVEYYGDNDWFNRNGKKVRSWKKTCERVWCREENKIEFPDGAPKGAERFYIKTEEGRVIVPEGWRNGQPTHSNFLYAERLKEQYAKEFKQSS